MNVKQYTYRIGFIILNYFTNEDTFNCIRSIEENFLEEDYCVVVVDNGSSENAQFKLKAQLETKPNIKVLLETKNMGFAKGNNAGINYIRTHKDFSAKFIACINSDIQFLHQGIITVLESEFEKNNFAVLGPLVISSNGRCDSNPANNTLDNSNQVYKLIRHLKKELLIRKTGLYRIVSPYRKIQMLLFPQKVTSKNYYETQFNVKLHGCALFFSPLFFNNFDGFDERTFLYLEEDFLLFHLRTKHLISEYCPKIIVFHKEHSTTIKMTKNFIEMLNFRDEWTLDSALKLFGLMSEKEKI